MVGSAENGGGVGGKWVVTDHGQEDSLGGEENALQLIVVMVAQLYGNKKTH